MDVNDVLLGLAEHSPLAAVCVVLGVALRSKDKELTQERAAAVTRADAFADKALAIQDRVSVTVNKLNDVFEELMRRERA